MVIQSPCRHTPGNTPKYALRYRSPPGSFQKYNGIDGIGTVTTSSPTSPVSGRPCSSHASTRVPRKRHWISPATTGLVGQPPT